MPPPLHTAAIAGDGQAIKKLCVENSGDPTSLQPLSLVLSICIVKGHSHCRHEFMCAGSQMAHSFFICLGAVDVIDTTGSTALHWAANHVRLLLLVTGSPT